MGYGAVPYILAYLKSVFPSFTDMVMHYFYILMWMVLIIHILPDLRHSWFLSPQESLRFDELPVAEVHPMILWK